MCSFLKIRYLSRKIVLVILTKDLGAFTKLESRKSAKDQEMDFNSLILRVNS